MPLGQSSGQPPSLSREKITPPVLTSSMEFRHVISGLLVLASPDHSVSRTHRQRREMWSCPRDEGWPLEAGSQVQASNHCKLRSSRAMVVPILFHLLVPGGRWLTTMSR